MKQHNLLALLAMAFASLFLVGCDDEPIKNEPPVPDPVIHFEDGSISVPYEGGDFTTAYTIENPVPGNVVIVNCDDDWVGEMSTITAGVIAFTVLPNYTDQPRETVLKIQYTAIDQEYEILIQQDVADKARFSYEVLSKSLNTMEIAIDPLDVETPYICRTYTVEHINAFELTTDQALFAYEMEAIAYDAQNKGESFQNYIRNLVHTGPETVMLENLIPDKDYQVYTYHIDLSDFSLVRGIYRETIRSGKPDPIDIGFEASYDVDGATIVQHITPDKEHVPYFCDYMKVSDFYSYYGADADMVETFIGDWNFNVFALLSMGYYESQLLDQYAYYGEQTLSYRELEAETEYVFYVFALDPGSVYVASELTMDRVTTGSASESDMTIDIEVANITATAADVFWTASDPDGRFARSVFTKTEYNALGATDEERFSALLEYSLIYFEGATDMNLSNLIPGTTYVAFAFGVEGETPNTRIFTCEFTTLTE